MILWHYTSTNVLSSIFSQGEPTVRASHINFLNDSAELKHGLEAIKTILPTIPGYTSEQVVQTVTELLRDDYDPNLFSFSLSEAEDSLYQWLAYCPRELGIALGFEFTDDRLKPNLAHFEDVFSLPLIQVNSRQIPQYRKCNYFISFEEIDKSWFIFNSEKTLEPQLLTNAMFLKHKAFSFEHEHRFFFHPLPESVMYVPAKFLGSKPYVEFNFKPAALKCIYVSPRGNQAVTEKLVRKMLKTYDLSHVSVKISRIPFRE